MSKSKQDILRLLKNDEYISGQSMADQLGISRTSVWKSIKALKAEGYQITSVPNKGHRLIAPPGYINQTALEVLVEHSEVFGHIEYLQTVDSTQNIAFKMLDTYDGAFIVVSEEQTKGRGRFNRNWASPKQRGLYISLVLRPNVPLTDIIRFNLFISLAISKSIDETFNLSSGIKWPNDIYINNKKVCGFLTEVVSEGNAVNAVVCGIGINIFNDAALSSLPRATSIEAEMAEGEGLDTDIFMKHLFRNLEHYYGLFLKHPFTAIRDEWKAKSIIFDKYLKISETGDSFMARALDIDEGGFLEVVDENGRLRRVISADIEL
ncbi:biotin--[acetyl-CoA-carboxylase] ligase [Salinicoccus siamensis]|uniref:Bifunctional ligase/repressor BirA n=1 Tax=Salinicoccus siamensis TaxID=381830 RepID=A0ABV5Z4B5_9STAP